MCACVWWGGGQRGVILMPYEVEVAHAVWWQQGEAEVLESMTHD